MFNAFVLDAVSDGHTDFCYKTQRDAQQLLIQFNLEIDRIIQEHGTEKTGIAVWYCYGCVSGMIHDVLDDAVADGWATFYDSMKSLYNNGFAKHCENKFHHRLRETKFGTSCYMLWDMDGMEYLTFNRTESQQRVAEPLMDFGLRHHHAVVQESFLHGLGHQMHTHTEFVQPKIEEFLRRDDLQPEIREYAMQCKTGCIL
jgi:hypothetical protein